VDDAPAVRLRYDGRSGAIRFAAGDLRRALAARGVAVTERYLDNDGTAAPNEVLLRTPRDSVRDFYRAFNGDEVEPIADESFSISIGDDGSALVEAPEERGLMYGALELAERVERSGWPLEPGTDQARAAIGIRGIKFNLPHAAYAPGEPFWRNDSLVLSRDFWSGYLDLLARSRFNLLTLWSKHPWDLLVTSERFRGTNPRSDIQMAEHRALFTELLDRAGDRGIDVVLFTWNIGLTPQAAAALGVPALGIGGLGQAEALRVRQHSPAVRDYVEEMVYQTLVTYPRLRGIGTSASEDMVGSGVDRQNWVTDAYASAYQRSGRRPWYIQRTNLQGAGHEIRESIQPKFPPNRFFISWKYANAHAYSHPRPAFEELWKAWDGVDLETTNVLFTVRNDDVNTHQWADQDYVRSFTTHMASKSYVRGFYWGSDGYLLGRDFQHIDHGHKTWTWDWERHALQLGLWGRLAYDHDAPASLAVDLARATHGTFAAVAVRGLQHASRIIPAVNRIVWRDYDYQWHPEMCLTSDGGFRTVVDFVDAEPMPGVGVVGIAELAAARSRDHRDPGGETVTDVVALLRSSSDGAEDAADEIEAASDPLPSLTDCLAHDLRSMAALGRYYACKLTAAYELSVLRIDGDESHRTRAIEQLERAIQEWAAVGFHWGRHYRPYDMPRVGRTFGYPYYLGDVEHDVELARRFGDVHSPTNT
jgi:hypothetical protein